MGIQEIENKVYAILAKIKTEISPILWANGKNEMLTGKYWGISAVEMVYLFVEVEKEFGIVIDAKKIVNYEFNTIRGIIKILDKEIALRQ